MSEELYHELMGFSRPLSESEVAALNDLFDRPGWKVFMSMRKEEAEASNAIGMSISEEDEVRSMHRALYHGFMNDLTYESRFRDAVNQSAPITREELSIDM